MASKVNTSRCDLFVFGANDEGQLGNGRTQEKEFVPLRAIKGTTFRSMTIVGGSKHTLLQDERGNVFVAGLNDQFQLGYFGSLDGPQDGILASPIPVDRNFNEFVFKHSSIQHCAATWETSACVISAHNTPASTHPLIYTEGKGTNGELGRGTQLSTEGQATNQSAESINIVPLKPFLPDEVRSFAAGYAHYVAVLNNGQVWGWGRANKHQLGHFMKAHDGKNYIDAPRRLHGIDFEAHRVVCGKEFTYIVGDPKAGQHIIFGADKGGLKSKMPRSVTNWKQIGATWNAIYVLYEDGSLEAWGKEVMYELVPPGLPPIDQIAVGSEHILALSCASTLSSQKLISWGWGEHGNCGDVSNMDPLPAMPRCCITGRWNEIDIPGHILAIGAAQATSFVLTEVLQSTTEQDHSLTSGPPSEQE